MRHALCMQKKKEKVKRSTGRCVMRTHRACAIGLPGSSGLDLFFFNSDWSSFEKVER